MKNKKMIILSTFPCLVLSTSIVLAGEAKPGIKSPVKKDISTQAGIIEPVIVRKPKNPDAKSRQRPSSKKMIKKGQK